MKTITIPIILFLISSVYSVQIDSGVQIQPSSGTSYYVVNNTLNLGQLDVYAENATMTSVEQSKTRVEVLNSDGTISSYLSDLKTKIVIPSTNSLKNIYFTVSEAVVDYTYRYGGIITRNIYSGFKLGSLIPYIIGATALLGIIAVYIFR